MSEQVDPTPVGQLVLVRLLVAGDKGEASTKIKGDLEPLIGHRWAGAALADRLERALADLESSGLISRASKGKTRRSMLTADGRRRALGLLGLDHLPPRTTWVTMKKTYLAALALGLPAPEGEAVKKFNTDGVFQVALLKARFGLPLAESPKIDEAIAALAWTLMGFAPGRKFDAKTVQAALIRRALGETSEVGPRPDPKKEAVKLLAREVGARQSGKDELRLAAIRRWVDGQAIAPAAPARPAPPVPSGRPEGDRPLDLAAFARRVLEAARSSPTGRFGDNKVFVVHVWRNLQGDPAFASLGLDGFKRRLAEANNARLLDLSRADLVEAMDPQDVALSEILYLGATFHFVRI